MTELLTRPPAAVGGVTTEDTTSASLWWRGSLAALWAVAVGVAILMVCVLIAWATVYANTLRLARTSPVHALRYE